MNAIGTARRATITDLMRTEGKAELINGEIVRMSPGERPIFVAIEIYLELRAWVRAAPGRGKPYPEGMIFRVPVMASGRESFVPDAAYATGPFPADPEGVYDGVPLFAAEVRSADGYGPAAEAKAALKRDDYFASGTLVVWDVDQRGRVIYCYVASAPLVPRVFGPGEEADAEPAVPGWRVKVDAVML